MKSLLTAALGGILSLAMYTQASAQTYCDAALDAETASVMPVPTGTPANIAAFSGVWGPDKWNGMLCSVLIVKSVQPDGAADVVYLWGKAESWNIWNPGYIRVLGKIEGSKLVFHNTFGIRVEYTYVDGKLKGVFGGNAHITTTKR